MPPSMRYFNESAPFWDFVASLEDHSSGQSFASTFASASNRVHSPHGLDEPSVTPGDGLHQPSPPSPTDAGGNHSSHRQGSHSPSPPPKHKHSHDHGGPAHCGPAGRGRHGRRGSSPHHHGPHGGPGGRRHGWGGQPGFGMGGPFNLGSLADYFQRQLFTDQRENDDNAPVQTNNEDFVPPVDIFDTESAFVVHVSLPGAKKEDVAANWLPEKSELSITGVIHRPGSEEFLKTLALDERKVGAFERKVRLGSRAHPAQIDADGITAKLEDGILRIEVPKEDKDYVEIKKVDIE